MRQLVPPATLQLIYKALIQPHFDYCNVVWGNCGVKLSDKLQKLQNRAARALTFSNYDADASQLFQNLNWKNLSTQRDIQKALMVFKSLHGLAPEYLSSKFIARSNTTSYPGGGGGTPLYGLYRYVPRNRVWFLEVLDP